jgi:hypothetical protein
MGVDGMCCETAKATAVSVEDGDGRSEGEIR